MLLSQDRLEIWPLFNEAFQVIVCADHKLAESASPELAIHAARDNQFTIMSGLEWTAQEKENLRSLGINLDSAHEVASIEDMKSLLTAGIGLALAPAHVLKEPNVQHLSIPLLQLKQAVAVCVVSGRHRPPEASALLSLLRMKDWEASENIDLGGQLPA